MQPPSIFSCAATSFGLTRACVQKARGSVSSNSTGGHSLYQDGCPLKGWTLVVFVQSRKGTPTGFVGSDSFLRRHPKSSSGRQFSLGELTAKSVQLVAHMSKRERQLTTYDGLLIWHGHGHPDFSPGGPKKHMILSGLCLQTEMSPGT